MLRALLFSILSSTLASIPLSPMVMARTHSQPDPPAGLTLGQLNSDEAFYIRGTELARAGKLDQALEELKKAAELAPDSPKVHNMLGLVLSQLGRLREADEAYARALAVAPEFFPARKNRAINSFTRKEFESAAKEFEALARLEPRDFVPHLFLGLLAIEAPDLQTALKHLLQARQLAPENAQVLLAVARVHFMLGERPPALEFARQMRTRSGSTEAELFELGVVLAQFQENAEAAEIFQELWWRKADSYDVGFNLALVQYRSGQLESALHTVEKLVLGGNQSGELLNLRGWIYSKMGRLDRAGESLEQAIEAEPDNADHYLDLSTVLQMEGDRESAIRVLTEGIQNHAGKDRLQVQLGVIYEENLDYQEAENQYRKALQTNRSNEPAYIALANLLLVTDRQQEALALLESALRWLPNSALIHYIYGSVLLTPLLRTGDEGHTELLEKASTLLEKALRLNPFFANTHYSLGRVYLAKGDHQKAEEYFRKACAFNPKHVKAYYELSRIALRRGQPEKAAELTEIVRKLSVEKHQEDKETFADLVRESLEGSWGRALGSQPKK